MDPARAGREGPKAALLHPPGRRRCPPARAAPRPIRRRLIGHRLCLRRPLGSSTACGTSLLPGWPQQDLVDGQAAWTAEDERDDLSDVCSGDLGLVVELLDALFSVGVGDVVRQLGGHDAWL